MVNFLILFVSLLSRILILLVVVEVILSYFMSPYHPVRSAILKIIDPILSPIRKVLPNIGMLDFSPIVLILLIQLAETLLIALLRSLG